MNSKKKILGIIPARYESSRFPGKPLVQIKSKPMIQWVYEGSKGMFDLLVVATDDERIAKVVKGFGGEVMMTSPDHRSGTERCNEVVGRIKQEYHSDYDIVVNVQGDEPLIQKTQLRELIKTIESDEAEIATLVKKLSKGEDPSNPNIVKAVLDTSNRAIFFSRSPIPYYRNASDPKENLYLKHIGLYAYKTSVLEQICSLPASGLEQAESLEQLRWIEHGFRIKVSFTDMENIGIDTPEDLDKLLSLLE